MTATARAELEAVLRRLGELLRRGAGVEAEALAADARRAFPLSGELARLHGVALLQAGRRREAWTALHRAAELAPGNIDVQCSLAGAALEDGHPEAAIERLRAALARVPDHPMALQGLGVALMMAARGEEARAALAEAVRVAPRQPELHLNLAEAELELGHDAAALARIREALRLAPRLPAAHALLGHALHTQGRAAEAAEAWLDAERLAQGEPRHSFQAGRALEDAGRLDDAAAAYARALQRAPGSGPAISRLAWIRRRLADWRGQAELTARLREAIVQGRPGIVPFALPIEPFDRALQRKALETFTRAVEQRLSPLRRQLAFAWRRPPPDAPIRLGLLSDGFGEHAVGRALAGMIEALAAPGGLELHLFAGNPGDGGPTRRRLAAAAPLHAIDALPPMQAARHIHAQGIEVLFDLTGFGARTHADLLALRPAPLQVSWLAYPGTSGAPWIDYLLADAVTLPPSHRADYSEKVLRLPRCLLPVDASPAAPPTDARHGGPGVVFACLADVRKIGPDTFARFARIVREVEGSVLWLRAGPPGADDRLRARAAEQGVAPERLAFLPSLPREAYLARYAQIDLCLDTLPCGARALAADALWAGCPWLTYAGDTFAGRVAASLLHHAGLPELAAANADDFVTTAVRLGRDAAALAALRSRVAALRGGSPVFDMTGFAVDFRRMVQAIGTRRRIGRPPIDLDF